MVILRSLVRGEIIIRGAEDRRVCRCPDLAERDEDGGGSWQHASPSAMRADRVLHPLQGGAIRLKKSLHIIAHPVCNGDQSRVPTALSSNSYGEDGYGMLVWKG